MMALLETYTTLETIFLFCALIGGLGLAIRIVMMFMGSDLHADGADSPDLHDMDFGGHDAADVGHDVAHDMHAHPTDSDISFRLLSFQGLTAFLLMFGLAGLATSQGFGWDKVQSMAAAVVAGLLAFWVLKILFESALKLQSRGNVNMDNAVNQQGVVYLTIPPQGTGKVQIRVQRRLCVLEATSDSSAAIKTGDTVRVVRLGANNILVVEKV